MRAIRSILFWLHLTAGIAAGGVIAIMAGTGVLLTYQRQIQAWADTRGLEAGPPAPDARPVAPERILEAAAEVREGEPTAIRWRRDPAAPVEVAYGRSGTVFVNGWTGEVLGSGSQRTRDFFRAVTDWHRWLAREDASRPAGRRVTGAANLAFLYLVLSGLVLWWPRNLTRRAFRNVTRFRRGLPPKARDFNWHNVIGFWSLVPLAIVVASGVVISYPWAGDLVYRVVGDTPPVRAEASRPGATVATPGGGPVGREADEAVQPPRVDPSTIPGLLAQARERMPEWRSIAVTLDATPEGGATLALDAGTGGQPQKRAQLVVSQATGAVLKWEPFSAGTPGRKARSLLRFAHTGEILGIPGQTVAGVVSAGALVLVWTGIALALRRLLSWVRRPRRTERPRPAAAAPPRERTAA